MARLCGVFLLIIAVATARKCSKYDIFSGGEFVRLPPDCTDLDLYKSGVTDDHATKLASALADHDQLAWISLSENKISEAGASALATAIENNSVLTTMKLFDQKGDGEISKATLKKIKKITKKNKENPYTKAEQAKIATARMEEVVAEGGVVKHVFAEGSGDSPADGAKVKAHYTGTLINGDKFDSSRDRNSPFEFTLGKGQVIGCWDQGFATMKVGERALLTCKSKYAYGDRGSPPKIPGGATLKFDVELLEFTNPDKEL